MTIYSISGLSADQRLFERLDLPGVEFVPRPWLAPLSEEKIDAYAGRMNEGVRADHPVLMGVSFGGMMAIEMAKQLPGATVIIVSSVGVRQQLPGWMRLSGALYLDKLLPVGSRKKSSLFDGLENYVMGIETEEDAELSRSFKNNVSMDYLKWAIHHILHWQNQWLPSSFFHIHGGRDHMFPIKNLQPTHVIPDGGHFMVYNRPVEVSRVLNQVLAGITG
jgi:pimeloyl-ACP methyl ester carboxylesterase